MNPDSIAIVLGRKGSKGVPDKNVMNILGIPAFHYPIIASKESKYVNDIFVSSDHDKILDGAKDLDVRIIKRPPRLCTDKALFEDALIHAYNEAKTLIDYHPKYVIVLMCNAVTINNKLIDTSIEMLENDSIADSVVTVSIFNMYSPLRARKINENGYLDPFVPLKTFGDVATLNCDRDSQGDTYFADMSHTVCRSECLENIENGLLPQKWMGKKILPILNQNGCDIDEPWQIDMSIRWLKKNNSFAD